MQFEGPAVLSERSTAKLLLIFSWEQNQAIKSVAASYIFFKNHPNFCYLSFLIHLLKKNRKTSILDIICGFFIPNLKGLNQVSLWDRGLWVWDGQKISKLTKLLLPALKLSLQKRFRNDYSFLDMSRVNQQMLTLFFQHLSRATDQHDCKDGSFPVTPICSRGNFQQRQIKVRLAIYNQPEQFLSNIPKKISSLDKRAP